MLYDDAYKKETQICYRAGMSARGRPMCIVRVEVLPREQRIEKFAIILLEYLHEFDMFELCTACFFTEKLACLVGVDRERNR